MRYKLLLCLVIGLCIVGCSSPTDSKKWPYYFPNEPRDWWSYDRADIHSGHVDTVNVLVVQFDTLDNGEHAVLRLIMAGDEIDSQWVQVKRGLGNDFGRDTVRVFSDRTGNNLEMIYLYPMQNGMSWQGVNEFDTVQIEGPRRVTTKAGSFNAFLVRNGWSHFEWSYRSTKLVVENVGLVQNAQVWLSGTETGS